MRVCGCVCMYCTSVGGYACVCACVTVIVYECMRRLTRSLYADQSIAKTHWHRKTLWSHTKYNNAPKMFFRRHPTSARHAERPQRPLPPPLILRTPLPLPPPPHPVRSKGPWKFPSRDGGASELIRRTLQLHVTHVTDCRFYCTKFSSFLFLWNCFIYLVIHEVMLQKTKQTIIHRYWLK